MRILIATAHRKLVGGVEKYLQAVIPGLLDRRHEVGILYEYPFDPCGERIDPAGISLRTWCLAELGMEAALQSLAEWKPDVVYWHGMDGAESIAMEDALLDTYPTVLYVHNYDRTCATGRKYHQFPQVQCCTRRLGPMCLVMHYPRRCGGLHPGTMWRRFERHSQLNARLARHQTILVASTHMYGEFRQHGVSPQQLHLVPLPATDSIPDATAPVPGPATGRVLFVGRLMDLKGVDYLIQAMPRAGNKLGRRLTLTVAGDGPERRKLETLAGRLGAAVEFVGWVQSEQKRNLMRHADLLAVPSLWPEPFGLVGMEAGGLGLPAVGYAVGGIPDWLISGETGELAPGDPPTAEGLADAMVRALASPDHYATLCLGAWRLSQNFTMEAHLAKLEPILGAEPVGAASEPAASRNRHRITGGPPARTSVL